MSRQADIERRLDQLGNRVREYADGAADTADGWLSRGRRAVGRLNRSDARKRIARQAEDFADEANYQYRRLVATWGGIRWPRRRSWPAR